MVKYITVLLMTIFLISGCSNDEYEREFTFDGEPESWHVSISGTLSQETDGIYEEAEGIYTYEGEEDIRSIVINTYTDGNRAMIGNELDELFSGESVETPFGNYRFWNLHDMGHDILVDFKWREGDKDSKREESITLKLVE